MHTLEATGPASSPEILADLWTRALERHKSGALDEALALYRACLEHRPDSAEAYYMLGLCQIQSRHSIEAEAALAQAARLKPADPLLQRSHGNILKVLGRYDEALRCYDVALALKPDYAETHRSRGQVLKSLGRIEAALAAYDAALAVRPDYPEAHLSRANLLAELGRSDAALEAYERTLALDPLCVEAYNNRGVLFNGQGRYREAIFSFCKAISLRKNYPEAFNNRGITLKSLGKYEAALQDYNNALSLRPDYPEAFNNQGNVFKEVQRAEEALASYDQAIALRPDYPEAYNNRAVVLADLHRGEEALRDYDQAIALRPDYAEAHFNRALCLLQLGRLAEGWPGYEWRWRNANLRMPSRSFPEPLWRGEALAGQTLLLYGEQGLGDAIQLCRYIPLVAARGGRVVLEVDRTLVGLLGQFDGLDQVVARGEPLPAFDFQCPLMSLPLAFGTTLDTIPTAPAYLTADPARVERWRTRLGPATRPRIGLVWSGNSHHRNDSCRSLPFAALTDLISERFDFLCLQKEIRDSEIVRAAERPGLRLFCDEIVDFADTAALCELADLVISVDTSVAHLAGALGRPLWLVLPANSDWRWLLDRPDSPWYPSARLYRQSVAEGLKGEWGPVLASLAREMEAHFA